MCYACERSPPYAVLLVLPSCLPKLFNAVVDALGWHVCHQGSGMSSTTWLTSLCGGRRCPSACKGVHRSSGANGVERVGVTCDVVSLPLAITVLRKDTCPSPVLGVCACVSNNVGRSPSAHVQFSYLQLNMYILSIYIYMYLQWLPGPGLLSLTMYYVKLLT